MIEFQNNVCFCDSFSWLTNNRLIHFSIGRCDVLGIDLHPAFRRGVVVGAGDAAPAQVSICIHVQVTLFDFVRCCVFHTYKIHRLFEIKLKCLLSFTESTKLTTYRT